MVNGAQVWITILPDLVRLVLAILCNVIGDFESLLLRSSTKWVGTKILGGGLYCWPLQDEAVS